jgi:hypothetical protein
VPLRMWQLVVTPFSACDRSAQCEAFRNHRLGLNLPDQSAANINRSLLSMVQTSTVGL